MKCGGLRNREQLQTTNFIRGRHRRLTLDIYSLRECVSKIWVTLVPVSLVVASVNGETSKVGYTADLARTFYRNARQSTKCVKIDWFLAHTYQKRIDKTALDENL